MVDVRLKSVSKVYGESTVAIDDLNIHVKDGELLALVGPSGSGKSTVLRTLAGLEQITEGAMEFDGTEVQDLIPSARSIAMVFQSYALYPKMTVGENIGYGIKHSTSLGKNERKVRVQEIARMLGIEKLLDASPSDLSGGQRQRVALGRALVRHPDVFLLDEPLSNLDAKLRASMRKELQHIHDKMNVTTLYVTHDQKEAMTMADRIAILHNGKLQQIDPPERAYNHPANQFVGTFLGSPAMNIFKAEVEESGESYLFRDVNSNRHIAKLSQRHLTEDIFDEVVNVGLRPEHLILQTSSEGDNFEAIVDVVEYQGKENYVHCNVGGTDFTVRMTVQDDIYPGDSVSISVAPEHVYLFNVETGDTLKSKTPANPSYKKTQ